MLCLFIKLLLNRTENLGPDRANRLILNNKLILPHINLYAGIDLTKGCIWCFFFNQNNLFRIQILFHDSTQRIKS